MEGSKEIFFVYAHDDEKLGNQLEKQLSLIKWQGLITGWHDREISTGMEWANEIDAHLNTASIILLLVSPDFMASDYCYSKEMKRAIERHESGEARVIPIILRPVYWKKSPFGKLQPLPKNAKPLTLWQNRDAAFFDVAEGIRKAVEELPPNLYTAAKSPIYDQTLPGLESEASNKLEELANDIRKSYSFIRGYEDIIRISDDPQEKAQAQQSIVKQSILARHYLDKYLKLADQLDVQVPIDITQIAAHFGETEFKAIS